MRFKRALWFAVLAAAIPFAAFLVADQIEPFPWSRLTRPPAVRVDARDGRPLRVFLAVDQRWRIPMRLSEMGPSLPRAVVASEDRWIGYHPGVNPLAIVRAAWQDLSAGRIVSGASTLAMQVARMTDPRPRTLGAKLLEAYRALQLTWHLPERKRIELYLNLAPMGGNIEGVGAASWLYFGKRPAQLSPGEVALLVALPRSPLAYDPIRHPRQARAARDRVLLQLEARGVFSRAEVEAARAESLPTRLRPVPFDAPLFSRFALGEVPGKARIEATIDRRLQALARDQVVRRIGELRQQGIGNAAAVVVDNRSHELAAMVGSAGFFDHEHQGQVNGAVAVRSPGSTLKPFLYALAFDRGLIIPASFMLDVPTDFSGYVPHDYDGRYRGRVTARQALIESLNAPAVRLLARVGLEDFVHLLRRGGLATLDRPAASYGLPLILGSGGVRLIDLTNLYSALADGGLYRPLVWRRGGGASAPGTRLFSPGAAWLVTESLMDLRRPDLPSAWRSARDVPAVAWKTGTSFGHRDAWAVGYSRDFSIGVWVGNFDGRPVEGISGAEDAAPLLFDLFRVIDPGGAAPPKPTSSELETVEVCAASHQLPGPFCPRRVRVEALAGRTRLATCEEHRRVLVDAASGRRLTPDCSRRHRYRWLVLDLPPPELVAFRRGRGEHVNGLPPLAADCGVNASGERPKIVSPDPSTPYRVRRDAPLSDQKILLSAEVGPGSHRLYWYQDGRLIATGGPAARLFVDLERGLHRLVVTDDLGRSAGVSYRVE